MKVLNLYAGIGGNRLKWSGVEVTAVEIEPKLCQVYQDFFPQDKVVEGDAHEYLLKNYASYDFVWTSPPCQSHSQFRQNMCVKRGQSEPVYAEMNLYQEIIFLKHNFKGLWVAENVKPYYDFLIAPTLKMERHFWWCNFNLEAKDFGKNKINLIKKGQINDLQEKHKIDLSKINLSNKRQVLRNCVNPDVGEYILNSAKEFGGFRE